MKNLFQKSEMEKMEKFIDDHLTCYRNKKKGQMKFKIKMSASSGIGIAVSIKCCSCKTKEDVSDYDNW